jgi:prepilin-type N-terminal cleavage/methylation domain-containing protein
MIMKKMKENKGFTLVELIVVIVILAILAAILVPALLGYIDRAKGQQVVLNGKTVLTAAQTECSSAYAKGTDLSTMDATTLKAFQDQINNTAFYKRKN